MKYTVSIDVPELGEGLRFCRDALGLAEVARPVVTYVVLKCGTSQIGLIENRRERNQQRELTTFVDISDTGLQFTSTSTSMTLKSS